MNVTYIQLRPMPHKKPADICCCPLNIKSTENVDIRRLREKFKYTPDVIGLLQSSKKKNNNNHSSYDINKKNTCSLILSPPQTYLYGMFQIKACSE